MQVDQDPLLLRTLRGEKVERPPVWMMRQAGRYMKASQETSTYRRYVLVSQYTCVY